MGSFVQKRVDVLTYPNTNLVHVPTERDVWPFHPVATNSFWVMADELSRDAAVPFERVEEEEEYVYQTCLKRKPQGGGYHY